MKLDKIGLNQPMDLPRLASRRTVCKHRQLNTTVTTRPTKASTWRDINLAANPNSASAELQVIVHAANQMLRIKCCDTVGGTIGGGLDAHNAGCVPKKK